VFERDAIERVAPNAKLELFTHQMAYGPRVVKQLPKVISKLGSDPATRQAVIMIANTDDVLDERPCTLSIQFHAQLDPVKNAYHISSTAYMRSSDAIWGLPNDIIQFGMLTHMVGNLFGVLNDCDVVMGESAVLVGNAHIYHDSDPSRKGRAWFKTVGPMTLPRLKSLPQWQNWALKLIKSTRTAGDLYTALNVVEDML
jgi:thymidylate synthase